MKQQWNLLLHALQFYSRIPVGQTNFSEENLSRSLRYFPLVGMIVGGVGGAVFMLCMLVFPQMVSVVAAMIAMITVTGALHEDGVSDFFDGFGGGYTKERILEIMKDSRVGAFGVISLIFLFLGKFALLTAIDPLHIPLTLIAAHAASRFPPALLMVTSTYARVGPSKSAHTKNPPSAPTFVIALLLAAAPLAFTPWQVGVTIIPVYTLIFLLIKRYTEKKIGGFTGDILGTLQQFCEVAFYAIVVYFY